MNTSVSRGLLCLVVATLSVSLTRAQDAPIPPHLAAAKMTLPEGFKATLFAGEPDVVQPIAFTFDDRGRLWVVECMSYPKWHTDPKDGKDRVLIFEDTDGDGKFDKRTVFADKLSNLSGIQYGFGGIWLCSTPNLLFIPIKEGEDKPAGPPQVLLDGWDLKAQHNVASSLTWGPDGWLYGCSGILNNVKVGAPGTPDKDRVRMNCGVWRYHPITKKFEAVAHGTTNPWGLDFDEYGEMFITNCVIDHLWHIVPGGHYQRMFGEDLNPHTYKLMPSICDHIHWGGGHWTTSRAPERASRVSGGSSDYHIHSEAGGGHAHAGCMIYLGDNWPARYRGGVFMCNLHGNRINHDILERNGSTYVARHGKDFMLANDPWFRGLSIQYGPDGGVYVSDWCDTGECHNYQVADKTNGRIYKVTFGHVKPWKGDLAKLDDLELVNLQLHGNEWEARHGRRLLQERAAGRALNNPKVLAVLKKMLNDIEPSPSKTLRALWTVHCINAVMDAKHFEYQFLSVNEHVRAWAARLWMEYRWGAVGAGGKFISLALRDTSALVRLHLASMVQRTSRDFARNLAGLLLEHVEDAQDPFVPLMLWYGFEPIVAAEPDLVEAQLFGSRPARIPLVREFLARRLVSAGSKDFGIESLLTRLGQFDSPPLHRDVLRGLHGALTGQRAVPMPEGWKDAYPVFAASPLAEVRQRALSLGTIFGDERAWKALEGIALSSKLDAPSRQMALQTMMATQKADVPAVLRNLLDDSVMRRPAIRGLAAFGNEPIPVVLLKRYPTWDDDEKADALQTLTSRPAFALALLDAISDKQVPRSDVSQVTIRQMLALKNAEVSKRVEEVWGKFSAPSKDKFALIAKYKAALGKETLKKANLANGRALYAKHCAACHKLFGEGGDVGPDLTGSQRANLDYVLENVLDPSAVVPNEYKVTIVETKNGRTLAGIIKSETAAAITVQLQNETVVVPKGDIESRTPTKMSMMPEGIFEQMAMDEVRDLVAYLANPVVSPKR